MAASFPNAKKTFSQVANGVTKLIASLFNQPYDEIEAIETYLGAIGSAQSYSESLKNLLIGYKKGCAVDYKGAADLYVRSGEIAIPDASGNVRLRRNTSDTTVAWTAIDTGSEANSTQYYIYAVADGSGTTFTVKISTNATTPSGCTFYKKIGSFYNDASGNILNIGNVVLGPEVNKILDYDGSSSAFTTIVPGQLKICFGTLTTSGGAGSVSNLPFFSATSYKVTLGGYYQDFYNISSQSASGFSVACSNGGTRYVNWIAIGV
jgi:hypothetical protein